MTVTPRTPAGYRDTANYRADHIPRGGPEHCQWTCKTNQQQLDIARAAGFDTRDPWEKYHDGYGANGRHIVTGTSRSEFKRMTNEQQARELAAALGLAAPAPAPEVAKLPERPHALTVAEHDRREAAHE